VLEYVFGYWDLPAPQPGVFDGEVLGNFGEGFVYWNSGLDTEMGERFISEMKPLGWWVGTFTKSRITNPHYLSR